MTIKEIGKKAIVPFTSALLGGAAVIAALKFSPSTNRTFPLPRDVDQSKMQILTEKDKIVLKFPKKKARV